MAAIHVLLGSCRQACHEMVPFIEAVYGTINKNPNAAVLKEDKSFFSLADGVVQVSCHAIINLHASRAHQRGSDDDAKF